MAGRKGGNNRSAVSGRFVKSGPSSRTVSEAGGKSGSTGGRFRSAISGRFVTDAHGRRSPNTTTHEK